MSDLKNELTDIRGVGDATADEILSVVEEHSVDSTVKENVRQAYDYY